MTSSWVKIAYLTLAWGLRMQMTYDLYHARQKLAA